MLPCKECNWAHLWGECRYGHKIEHIIYIGDRQDERDFIRNNCAIAPSKSATLIVHSTQNKLLGAQHIADLRQSVNVLTRNGVKQAAFILSTDLSLGKEESRLSDCLSTISQYCSSSNESVVVLLNQNFGLQLEPEFGRSHVEQMDTMARYGFFLSKELTYYTKQLYQIRKLGADEFGVLKEWAVTADWLTHYFDSKSDIGSFLKEYTGDMYVLEEIDKTIKAVAMLASGLGCINDDHAEKWLTELGLNAQNSIHILGIGTSSNNTLHAGKLLNYIVLKESLNHQLNHINVVSSNVSCTDDDYQILTKLKRWDAVKSEQKRTQIGTLTLKGCIIQADRWTVIEEEEKKVEPTLLEYLRDPSPTCCEHLHRKSCNSDHEQKYKATMDTSVSPSATELVPDSPQNSVPSLALEYGNFDSDHTICQPSSTVDALLPYSAHTCLEDSLDGSEVSADAGPKLSADSLKQVRNELIEQLEIMLGAKNEWNDKEEIIKFGLDSNTALDLFARLQALYPNVKLGARILFEYPTLKALTDYIVSELYGVESEEDDTLKGCLESHRRLFSSTSQHNGLLMNIIGIPSYTPNCGGSSRNSFWQMLVVGKNGITKAQSDREIRYENKHRYVEQYSRKGGFIIESVKNFDCQFFHISPKEAALMDPQQRYIMENTVYALEDALISGDVVRESACSVILGATSCDYEDLLHMQELSDSEAYLGTGNNHAVIAGRVSYFFGLNGPTYVVDTACSSSFFALHCTETAMKQYRLDYGITGGVGLLLSPFTYISYGKANMLSADNCCKTFDARANGYVRSEGCVICIVSHSDKEYYATVKSTSVNQDGASGGLTVPSAVAQQKMLKIALARANKGADYLSNIECHGTGTFLGDPIEVGAIKSVIAGTEQAGAINKFPIGSVKANIGHLEATSGMVGLLRTVYAGKCMRLPPQLHFLVKNPHCCIDSFARIPVTSDASVSNTISEFATGISSFGFSGSNCHAILARSAESVADNIYIKYQSQIATLSAKNQTSLKRMINDFYTSVGASGIDQNQLFLRYTTKDNHFRHRCCFVNNGQQVQIVERTSLMPAFNETVDKMAFLFTGQGVSYLNAGRGLIDNTDFFAAMKHCNDTFRMELKNASILSAIYPNGKEESENLSCSPLLQPVIFSCQYALAKLYATMDIYPKTMIGHSIGELSAAAVGGMMSFSDAVKLVSCRGKLTSRLSRNHGMLAIRASEFIVQQIINACHSIAEIAAVNTQNQVVISGSLACLDTMFIPLVAELGIGAKKLDVPVGFHSQQMKSLVNEFSDIANSIAYQKGTAEIISNVNCQTLVVPSGQYWCDQIVSQVRFADCVREGLNRQLDIFLELGPEPILLSMVNAIIGEKCPGKACLTLKSLTQSETRISTLLQSCGNLYVNGFNLTLPKYANCVNDNRMDVIPRYPFNKERFWAISNGVEASSVTPQHGIKIAKHPLIGVKVIHNNNVSFSNIIDPTQSYINYLLDYQVQGEVVFPAAAYVEVALSCYNAYVGISNPLILQDFTIVQPFLLTQTPMMQVVFHPFGNYSALTMHTLEANHTSQLLVECTIRVCDSKDDLGHSAVSFRDHLEVMKISTAQFYKKMESHGLNYGDSFQTVTRLSKSSAITVADLTTNLSLTNYNMHPVLLDGAFQVVVFLFAEQSETLFPLHFDRIIFKCALPDKCRALLNRKECNRNNGRLLADLKLYSQAEAELVTVSGYTLRVLQSQVRERTTMQSDVEKGIYKLAWIETTECASCFTASHSSIMLVGDKTITRAIDVTHDATTIEMVTNSEFTANSAIVVLLPTISPKHTSSTDIVTAYVHFVAFIASIITKICDCPNSQLLVVTDQKHVLNGVTKTVNKENRRHILTLLTGDETFTAQDLNTVLLKDPKHEVYSFQNDMFYYEKLLEVMEWKTNFILPSEGEYHLQKATTGITSDIQPVTIRKTKLMSNSVRVVAVGLNFKDLLNSMELHPVDAGALGSDFAGFTYESTTKSLPRDPLYGFAVGCLSSVTPINSDFVASVTDDVSFVAASTLPSPNLTSEYAMQKSNLLRYSSTLVVHMAAGGIGISTTQWAKNCDVDVNGTAGGLRKLQYLHDIGMNQLSSSWQVGYQTDQHMKNLHSKQCLINATSREGFMPVTLLLLAQAASFVEVGKRNIWPEGCTTAGTPDVDYSIIAFDLLTSGFRTELLNLMLSCEIGIVQPLPTSVFFGQEISNAFAFMKQAKQIGKIVMRIEQPFFTSFRTVSKTSAAVTGGAGMIGKLVSKWFLEHNVTPIVFTRSKQQTLKDMDIVHTCNIDVSEKNKVKLFFLDQEVSSPIKHIVHSAANLVGSSIKKTTLMVISKNFRSKVLGAWYMHLMSCSNASSFVLFSSIASSMGAPGLTAYAAANSFLDSLGLLRKELGLAINVINWGPWGGAGMAASLEVDVKKLDMKLITHSEGLAAFEVVLQNHLHHVTYVQKIDSREQHRLNPIEIKGYGHFKATEVASVMNEDATMSNRQKEVSSFSGKNPCVTVQSLVRQILGKDSEEEIDETQGFVEMGMDSLMLTELTEKLQHYFQGVVVLSSTSSFDYPNITRLVKYLSDLINPSVEEELVTSFKDTIPNYQTTRKQDTLIYVSGYASRFPAQELDSAGDLWQQIQEGRDAKVQIPESRWSWSAFYDADADSAGKCYTKYGCFIRNDISLFDAKFFRISPKEAVSMDPQQRINLELVWHTLEKSLVKPSSLQFTKCGVFIGNCNVDYAQLVSQMADESNKGAHYATGTSTSVLAGRIAYVYGLEGNAVSLDTACSSSLLAISFASKYMSTESVDYTLAGGANLLLTPITFIYTCKAHMLSSDGLCKTFDASADGYVRGEGCAIVGLSSNKRCLANVLTACVANQDGASGGLTVPNGVAQEALLKHGIQMRCMYFDAKVSPVVGIETHGSGTSLGDPIELNALRSALPQSSYEVRTIKTLIGHLEGAAGIAGFLRAHCELGNKKIGAHIHFKVPNPKAPFVSSAMAIPIVPHELGLKHVGCGISSFGFSGTNSHIVIDCVTARCNYPSANPENSISLNVLPLSAKSNDSLLKLN